MAETILTRPDRTSRVYAKTEVKEGTFEIDNATYGVRAEDVGPPRGY